MFHIKPTPPNITPQPGICYTTSTVNIALSLVATIFSRNNQLAITVELELFQGYSRIMARLAGRVGSWVGSG